MKSQHVWLFTGVVMVSGILACSVSTTPRASESTEPGFEAVEEGDDSGADEESPEPTEIPPSVAAPQQPPTEEITAEPTEHVMDPEVAKAFALTPEELLLNMDWGGAGAEPGEDDLTPSLGGFDSGERVVVSEFFNSWPGGVAQIYESVTNDAGEVLFDPPISISADSYWLIGEHGHTVKTGGGEVEYIRGLDDVYGRTYPPTKDILYEIFWVQNYRPEFDRRGCSEAATLVLFDDEEYVVVEEISGEFWDGEVVFPVGAALRAFTPDPICYEGEWWFALTWIDGSMTAYFRELDLDGVLYITD